VTPYRRTSLWEPATKRRDRRAFRGALLGGALAVGIGLWLSRTQPSRATAAQQLVHHLAFERYVEWHAEFPTLRCPPRLGELGGAVLDPWGHAMHYTCDHRLMHERADIVVMSAGEDGVFGTADDLRSTR
jgi:hypothetical protein